MNRVSLAGRLAADPESIITKNGATVCRISVACNDISSRKNEVYFFPCVAWDARAKFISVYLKKGSPVVIDGRLQRRSYVNSDGNNVYNTEVLIDNIRSFGTSNLNNISRDNYKTFKEDVFEKNKSDEVIVENQEKEISSKTNLNFQDDEKNKDENMVEDFDLDWLDEIDN